MNLKKNIPHDPDFKIRVSDSFDSQGFMHFIEAKLTKIEPGYCEIELPFSEKLTQQHGFFHAGVVGTIADNAAGYAAFSLMDADSSILTAEFKINFLAPAKGEYLVSKAKVIKGGKTLTICQSEVYAVSKQKEKLCALAQVTLMQLRGRSDGK